MDGTALPASTLPPPEPLLLRVGGTTLFAVRHRCADKLHARVLLCPPILQEHTRSYRFFAQLSELWARQGLEVIRFDYSGTGDSSGSTLDFNPQQAIRDIRTIWDALMDGDPGVPQIICGVRFGSLLAAHALEQGLPADMAWWWLPTRSGDRYLEVLEAIDCRERASRSRFPNGPAPPPEIGELLGFALDPACLRAIRAMHWPELGTPALHVLGDEDDVDPTKSDACVHLPPELSDWVGQVDFEAILPIKLAAPASEYLLASLQGAHR